MVSMVIVAICFMLSLVFFVVFYILCAFYEACMISLSIL